MWPSILARQRCSKAEESLIRCGTWLNCCTFLFYLVLMNGSGIAKEPSGTEVGKWGAEPADVGLPSPESVNRTRTD